ncbi:UNVERIFIED_ORG: citrate lyase beta subunit [Ensifer adhaerens]|nr:citrate lyase beta subunit [Ensifer adhaerens]
MSVNRFKTMKPLLFQSAGAPLPTSVDLNAFDGIIVDLGFGDDALAQLVAVARGACRVFARIPPINRLAAEDMASLLRNDISGLLLSGCRSRTDVQRLDVMLRVAEANVGNRLQQVAILAEYCSVPESVLSPYSLGESSPRLEGIIFDASALAAAIGCRPSKEPQDEVLVAPIAAGRAAAALRAHEAGLGCYEMLPQTAVTEKAVRRAFAASRANGFSSVVCRSPEQAAWLDTGG